MAVGEVIESTHLYHPGPLQKGFQATIECLQRLEGKALYIHYQIPRGDTNSFFPHITELELLLFPHILSFDFPIGGLIASTTLVTTGVEIFFLCPCRTPDETSCILSRQSIQLTILTSSTWKVETHSPNIFSKEYLRLCVLVYERMLHKGARLFKGKHKEKTVK